MPEEQFEAWFRSLDKDGDGHIDMAEMANYLKTLANKIERTDVLRMSDYNNPFSQQKKKKALTVADVIGVQTN